LPKYYAYKVCGDFLYFTAKCIVEAMHVHASDSRLTEEGSAKFFVRDDGSSIVQKRGSLTDRELRKIQVFIQKNYRDMYRTWSQVSNEGFYRGE
jgi:hypothetical protein